MVFGWVDNAVKRMRWFDISLIKLATAAFILMIAVLWEPILSLEWYWYLAIGVLASIRPMVMLCKKDTSSAAVPPSA